VHERRELSYAIDQHDHLIRVDEGYYRFAAENGWDEATTSLGRSLRDYVAGHEMVKLQRLLVRRIRDEVGDVEFKVDGEWVEVEKAARRLGSSTVPSCPLSATASAPTATQCCWPRREHAAARSLFFRARRQPLTLHCGDHDQDRNP
jgi:hypothetical protein